MTDPPNGPQVELSEDEARVLGALIEKHMTTPDHYPLSTASLRAACNQSSNREPVVSYSEDAIIDAINGLRAKGLARTVKRSGERAIKHLETADEGLDIDRRQKALLAVLLLRGPQTVGELRSRTERYCNFADLDEVDATLRAMETADIPTVRLIPRQPGQKEPRYTDLLCPRAPDREDGGRDREERDFSPASPRPESEINLLEEIADLKQQVADLRSAVDELKALIAD